MDGDGDNNDSLQALTENLSGGHTMNVLPGISQPGLASVTSSPSSPDLESSASPLNSCAVLGHECPH